MKKEIKKLLIISLIFGLFLQGNAVHALNKEETIYAKLKENGEIDSVSVSEHLFNSNEETINDKTILNNIKNINGSEKFRKSDDIVIWDANGKDIRYQGTIEKKLPIEVSVQYYLNDEEKNVNDIIGAKGKIKIIITYKNNSYQMMNINGKMEKIYVPYAIVTTSILNNTDNTNIKVSNGKIIDNGITSVIMALSSPGLYDSLKLDELKKMNKVEITFDTDNFALNALYSVATTSLFDDNSLDVFDDVNNLYKSINLLQSNMNKIVDASKKLSTGSKQMNDGLTELNKKVGELTSKYQYYRNKNQNELKEELLKIVEENINKITPELENEIINEANLLIKENIQELEQDVILYTRKNTKLVVDEKVSKVIQGLDINNIIENILNGNLSNLLTNDLEVQTLTNSLKSDIENDLKTIINQEFNNLKNNVVSSMTEEQKQTYIEYFVTNYNLTPADADEIVTKVQNDTINMVRNSLGQINFTDKIIATLNDKNYLSNVANGYVAKLNAKLNHNIDQDHTIKDLINDVKLKIIEAVKKDMETNNLYLDTDVKTYLTSLVNEIVDNTSHDLSSKYAKDYTNKVVKAVITKQFSPEHIDSKLRLLLDKYDDEIQNKVTILDDTINSLSNAISKLNEGSNQLSNGMNELSNGLSKYNKEGIHKLNKLVNGDVKSTQKRLEAIIKLSNENRMIDCVPKGANTSSKIIFMIDSIDKLEEKKNTLKEEKTDSIGDKITGLFK